MPFDKHWHI